MSTTPKQKEHQDQAIEDIKNRIDQIPEFRTSQEKYVRKERRRFDHPRKQQT